MSQGPLVVVYGSYSIAVVEVGVGVVVGFEAAAVAMAAAIVVKVVKVVGGYAAEAVPVPAVDWQGCFAEEVVLAAKDSESGRAYLIGARCLDQLQTGPVGAGYQLVACLYETQRKKASENATSLPMAGKMHPVLTAGH